MCLAKLGSLNALELLKHRNTLKKYIGAALPSADSLSRIFSLINSNAISNINKEFYRQLKRNKALMPPAHGLMALILDGHESHATYRRHCSGCLERRIGPEGNERIQYYHRNVTALLVCGDYCFFVDAEPQQPGNGKLPAQLGCLKEY